MRFFDFLTPGILAGIACITAFGVGASITFMLFPLLLEGMGVSKTMIGVHTATSAMAMLLGAPIMPRLMERFGLVKFLISGSIVCILILPGFMLTDNYWAWTVLRFIYSLGVTSLFVGSELWIISAANEQTRGRVVGLYGTALSIGFVTGPVVLSTIGTAGWGAILVAMVFSFVAIFCVYISRKNVPKDHQNDAHTSGIFTSFGFLKTDPTIMAAVILFGVAEFGILALIPVWGINIGYTEAAAILLGGSMALGNIVSQFPLGYLADKLDRRNMLLTFGIASLLAAISLPLISDFLPLVWIILLLWGGLVAGLYTVALVEIGARYRGAKLGAANAAIIIAYGIGALIGPPTAGILMDLIGPHGLELALGIFAAIFLLIAVLRKRKSEKTGNSA